MTWLKHGPDVVHVANLFTFCNIYHLNLMDYFLFFKNLLEVNLW